MSISSFHGLETSLRGLLAQQRALDVTSHNIANAGRTGYTRQTAIMQSTTPLDIAATAQGIMHAQLGSGIDVTQYQRVRDQFVDLQYRAANMTLGQQSTLAQRLGQVDDAFAEPSDNGLNAQLSKFWDAWDALAAHPESSAAKQAVIGAGTTLASTFKSLDSQLSSISGYASAEYTSLTAANGPIAKDATEIANLNASIKQIQGAGGQPNDLLDRRDELLDELSGYGQVSITDLGNGSIKVFFGGSATALVDDTTANAVPALTTPGGKLQGLLDTQTDVATYRGLLDTVASTLANNVNTAQGTTFFTGATAATLTVTATAASVVAGSAGTGDNTTALATARLRNTSTANSGYTDLVQQMGSDVAGAQQGEASAQALTTAADSRRQSANGVSLDEEMTNMIRFQRGYQASSRALSTMDEMLDVLINRTGKVGL